MACTFSRIDFLKTSPSLASSEMATKEPPLPNTSENSIMICR